MKSYVWLSFAFMGWAYYEMSGGSDFVPEEREVAQAQAPEIVSRAVTTTLLSVSASNVAPQPSDADINAALLEAVALDTSELATQVVQPVAPAPEPEVIQIVAPVVENKIDLREVAGSRVNMRSGPGTTFDVITTLDSGTKLEVLEIDADGWANVATVDRGIQGWMAERLLTEPET